MTGTVVTVESLCNLLTRSRLLKPAQVQSAYKQWRGVEPRASAGEPERFTQWLVRQHFVTLYQARQLSVGQANHFFLNHYKLLDLIGSGRMAGIFKAAHSLGHIVALKLMPAARSRDPEVLSRFKRESRMAARLKHPNIVRAFHLGNADGRHYIVMEYLEGETLEDVLKRRTKLPVAEGVRLVHQALAGLQHIHEQGMIHRDLKPANLMLVPPRPPGAPDNTLHSTIKVLDIGVGRFMFDEGPPGGSLGRDLTTAGTMLGTAEYMSPEQAKHAHQANIRSDVYSLGCVLYHVLAGRPPFTGTNDVHLILQHLTAQPTPVRDLAPAVPAGLQAVIDSMLAKSPDQRYATPQLAAQALQPFLTTPGSQGEEASSLTRSYLKWVEEQPIEEVNNAPPPTERWYYSRNGITIGPFLTAQLTQQATVGKLGPTDLVWMEGDNPDLAIPAKAAVDFAGIAAAKQAGQRPAKGTGTKAPVAAAPAVSPSVQEMGFDPDTGQIFDQAKFKKWQRAQEEKRKQAVATAPTASEVFQKGRRSLDAWLDLDRNRLPILAGDMEHIRQDADIQRFMHFHARYGQEMLHKLWLHLQFMAENRRKYYCALG